MKKNFCFLLLIVLLTANKGTAQNTDADAMKTWQDYMTPGKMHQMLAEANGDWEGAISMWMQPGAPPAQTTGLAHNEMILGGRYQQSTMTMTIMGMKTEGRNLLAYDNIKKVFVDTWIDNMGTGVITLTGTLNEKTNTIEFKGVETDPMTGKDQTVRETFQFTDKDHQKMEMFVVQNGTEFKTMEVLYTRKK